MQKSKKLSLFSLALMSIVLGSAFAVNNILEKWRISNSAISITGRLAVYNLDGSEVYAHDWGEFRINEAKNWTVKVVNIGGDRVNVAWRSDGLSSGWSVKAYFGGFWNSTETTNIYPEADDSSTFYMPLDPQQCFFVEFILQKVGASSNVDFGLNIMSVAI